MLLNVIAYTGGRLVGQSIVVDRQKCNSNLRRRGTSVIVRSGPSLRREQLHERIAAMVRGDFKLVYLAPERLLMADFLTGPLEQLAAGPGINAFGPGG